MRDAWDKSGVAAAHREKREGRGEKLKVGFPFPQAGSDLPDPFCEFLHSVPTNWQTTTFDP